MNEFLKSEMQRLVALDRRLRAERAATAEKLAQLDDELAAVQGAIVQTQAITARFQQETTNANQPNPDPHTRPADEAR